MEAVLSEQEALREKALQCLEKWFKFGIPVETVCQRQVFPLIFDCLLSHRTFHFAVDTLLELVGSKSKKTVSFTSAAFQSTLSYDHPNHIPFVCEIIRRLVTQLRPLYDRALESEDMAVCRGLSQIAVALASGNISFIRNSDSIEVQKLLEFILVCTANPDLSISPITFPFWLDLEHNAMQYRGNPLISSWFSKCFNILVAQVHVVHATRVAHAVCPLL